MKLKSLVVLDVTKNKIEEFPPGFAQLLSLSDLHASENCIEELPEDFGQSVWLNFFCSCVYTNACHCDDNVEIFVVYDIVLAKACVQSCRCTVIFW